MVAKRGLQKSTIECEGELGSLAGSALHGQHRRSSRSARRFADRQAQTSDAVGASGRGVGLRKRIEKMGDFFRPDSKTGIDDADGDSTGISRGCRRSPECTDRDTAGIRELQSVTHQSLLDLPDTSGVTGEREIAGKVIVKNVAPS